MNRPPAPNSAGCASERGHCGKDATTADLQDLLVHAVKGIAQYAGRLRALNAPDRQAGAFILYAMMELLRLTLRDPARNYTFRTLNDTSREKSAT